MEEWKDAYGYEGIYQVSSIGQARSLDRRVCIGTRYEKTVPGKILSKKNIRGYDNVTFCVNNKLRTIQLHRLIMLTFKFVEGHRNLQVNHIDGVKNNNNIENLEWVTGSENLKHAYMNNLCKSQKGVLNNNSKLNEYEVYQIKFVLPYLSESQCARIFNVSRSLINLIRNNFVWKHVEIRCID